MASRRYTIMLSGTVSTMQWVYEFYQTSDEMAKDYAERVLKHDPCARHAMRADLFKLEENKIAGWEFRQPEAELKLV